MFLVRRRNFKHGTRSDDRHSIWIFVCWAKDIDRQLQRERITQEYIEFSKTVLVLIKAKKKRTQTFNSNDYSWEFFSTLSV